MIRSPPPSPLLADPSRPATPDPLRRGSSSSSRKARRTGRCCTSLARPSGRMHVLLVEDERATARMLAKGLREQAYAVDIVHDGVSACQRVAESDTTSSCS